MIRRDESSRDLPEESLPRRLLWPSWERRRRLARIEGWIFVVLCYGVLAFGYLMPQDALGPEPWRLRAVWAAFLVRVFVVHLGIVAALTFLFATWTRERKLIWATLPILAFTLGPALWQFNQQDPPLLLGEPVKVMSVNLLSVNPDTTTMIREINAFEPDLLLLQEYAPHWDAALRKILGRAYPHRIAAIRSDSFGSAIYSRLPFLGKVERELPLGESGVPQLRAVVRLPWGPAAVYNVHLLPPRTAEYVAEQRRQMADLAGLLAAERLPTILAGDFNFTPTTHFADRLRSLALEDGQRQGGWGVGTTWPVNGLLRYLPGLRLDQIWISPELACVRSRTGRGEGSDHRPLLMWIGLRPGQAR